MPPHTTRGTLAAPLRLSRNPPPEASGLSPRVNESTEPPEEAEEAAAEEEAVDEEEAEEEAVAVSVACQALSSCTSSSK